MMCIEKVKGTDWLWRKAGTKQNMAACGGVIMSFIRPCGRYKEVESDVETEMKLIKGLGELICLPV